MNIDFLTFSNFLKQVLWLQKSMTHGWIQWIKIHHLKVQVKDFQNCVNYLCLCPFTSPKSLREIDWLIEHIVNPKNLLRFENLESNVLWFHRNKNLLSHNFRSLLFEFIQLQRNTRQIYQLSFLIFNSSISVISLVLKPFLFIFFSNFFWQHLRNYNFFITQPKIYLYK